MRRLFVPPGSLGESEILVAGPEFHHLAHVLRVRSGEAMIVMDGAGQARHAVIEHIAKAEITARIVGQAAVPPSPPVDVTVAQAIGKGDRFEQVVQHATELGASAFVPLTTSRTVVKIDPRGVNDKRTRWWSVAKGAAEQSGRERIPDIHAPADIAELARTFPRFKSVLALDASGVPLARILNERAIVEQSPCILLVGPEGGFSPEEVDTLRKAGAEIASLGPYILRTETAALAALSQLMFWAAGEGGCSTLPT